MVLSPLCTTARTLGETIGPAGCGILDQVGSRKPSPRYMVIPYNLYNCGQNEVYDIITYNHGSPGNNYILYCTLDKYSPAQHTLSSFLIVLKIMTKQAFECHYN